MTRQEVEDICPYDIYDEPTRHASWVAVMMEILNDPHKWGLYEIGPLTDTELPTAEEFYSKCRIEWDEGSYSPPDIIKVMKAYGELVRVVALKSARNLANGWEGHEELNEAILNCFPPENIK